MLCLLKRLVFTSLLCLTLSYADSLDSQVAGGSTSLDFQSYILDNRSFLLVPKSVEFVEILSNELFSKTGYSLYVAVVDKTPESQQNIIDETLPPKELAKLRRTQYKDSLLQHLKAPYTLIFFMRDDEKMGIISSEPHKYFNEDKVYFEYMVPLLPKQKDEALSPQLVSAVVLNGYAQAADMIAEHFDVKLENNMPVDESGGRDFVRFSMYAMLLIMFGIIIR
ncbi:hypothetical protein [Helicobacter typhlonius]|uniref:hypothetical protein n=1 Tax=Helicobacter typhlonius TaxID=76936 RepID=UPI002FE133BA